MGTLYQYSRPRAGAPSSSRGRPQRGRPATTFWNVAAWGGFLAPPCQTVRLRVEGHRVSPCLRFPFAQRGVL